ncbi:MAG: S-methyl-5-thioribose-1-phosphate isomerase [Firmicutes bacterium]|nr:S-methyl-5-thioribose-1-phosphate isomerase [Bacillota bacterium]
MEEVQPIIWDGTTLYLLDQRLLPGKETYLPCRSAHDVAESIKNMVVRGAPAIGIAAAFGMVLAARNLLSSMTDQQDSSALPPYFLEKLREAAILLKETRPTAVNLAWAVGRIMEKAEKLGAETPDKVQKELEAEAKKLYAEDIEINKRIGRWGAELIQDGSTVLTHCNAGALATAGYGTALGVIRSAFFQGKKIRVFADETRPFLQGSRLTVWELKKEKIPVTLIVDSAAGYYMSKKRIHCVVVGADRVAANGDTANKIGTYSLAVLAKENNIPFYVAVPFSTFDFSIDSGSDIIVEERDSGEVTHLNNALLTVPGISVGNPAFDITPASLISAFITEYGVLHAPNRKKIEEFFSQKKSITLEK